MDPKEKEQYDLIMEFVISMKCASMKWPDPDTGEEQSRGITGEMIRSFLHYRKKKKT